MWDEKCSNNSDRYPVKILTTPPGTSDVCSTSANVMEHSGLLSDANTTTVFPPAMMGAMIETKPINDDSFGATAETTPVGSG